MNGPKVKGTETRPAVMPQRFLNKLDRVKKRKALSEGQTPDSVAARLQRYLLHRAQWHPEGS